MPAIALLLAAAWGGAPAAPADAPAGGASDAPSGRIADGDSVSTDEMKAARQLHPMVVLSDGRVLAVGGRGAGHGAPGPPGVNAEVDLYDPATGIWTPTGSLAKERQDPILFQLPDGTVMAAGGMATNLEFPATTEIWDPATGLWSPGPEMNSPRETPAAVQFADGRIFVTGGLPDRDLVAVDEDPSLLSMGSTGGTSQWAGSDFYRMVCPAREDYRISRIERTVGQLETLQSEGLSLDFIRYYVRWEDVDAKTTPSAIEKFCFCNNCLELMQRELRFVFPGTVGSRRQKAQWVLKEKLDGWVEWKCGVIHSMVAELRKAALVCSPSIKIALHGVPWTESEFGGGRRIVAGQDFAALSPFVDLFHPMCYFHMMGRPPEWVQNVVQDYTKTTGNPVLPSVQVNRFFREDPITAHAWDLHLKAALRPLSLGINLWEWSLIREDSEKSAVLRELLVG